MTLGRIVALPRRAFAFAGAQPRERFVQRLLVQRTVRLDHEPWWYVAARVVQAGQACRLAAGARDVGRARIAREENAARGEGISGERFESDHDSACTPSGMMPRKR